MRIKIIHLLLLISAFVLTANCQTNAKQEKTKPCKYLSFADAGKILGRKVELVTNSWNFSNDESRFDCNYRSVENDKISGREINLFFRLDESASENEAKRIYAEIWNSNKNHDGIEVLDDFGDEAYFHGDGSNFHFLLARKGKFTIRLKINKAVETASPGKLKSFAKNIIEKL